jgi:uncharacterized protein (DUF433 family)
MTPASNSETATTQVPNLTLSSEQIAQLNWLRMAIGAENTKEAILRSISVMVTLKQNLKSGSQLFIHNSDGQIRLLIPELEPNPTENWQYLVERSHPWRRQLYIKGRKLLASTVWRDAIANEMSPEEAAENWDLPLAAIQEVMQYCERHQELLQLEAEEERYRLEEKGVSSCWSIT